MDRHYLKQTRMGPDENVKKILRQLNGEAGDEESEIFQKWLSENPDNKNMYDEIRTIWNLKMNKDLEFSAVKAEAIINRIADKHNSKVKIWHSVRTVAAVLLIILTTGTIVFYQNFHRSAFEGKLADYKMITRTAGHGEQVKVILPDSSVVWLNALSSISYPEHFEKDHRTVNLTGEAFFDVCHDATRPFSVHSRDITTTVLGTSFNIHAFQDEDVTVTVATGRVEVQNDHGNHLQQVILEPGKQAVYTPEKEAFCVRDVNPENFYSWTHGIIRFNDDSIKDVMRTLERWYGISVMLQDDVEDSKIRVNGQYKNKDLKAILDGFHFMYNLSYQYIREDSVLILLNRKN